MFFQPLKPPLKLDYSRNLAIIYMLQEENYPSDQLKICSKCLNEKPISEFNFKQQKIGLRHSYCRECGKEFTRRHYKENKRQYLDRNARSYARRRDLVRRMMSRPCTDCGIQYPYYVMDFDHREGEVKEYELNCVDRMTIHAILREIGKCDVVCANCHRQRTWQRRMKKQASGLSEFLEPN